MSDDRIPYATHREDLVAWLREQLIGPGHRSDTESDERGRLIGQAPSGRYPTGILFPIFKDGTGLDPATAPDQDSDLEPDDGPGPDREFEQKDGQASRRRRYIPPSAAGLSFYAEQPLELHIVPWAVRYQKTSNREQQWRRVPLCRYEEVYETVSTPPEAGESRRPLWNGRAELFTLWRRQGKGWLVTISLCNRQQYDPVRTGPKRSDQQRDIEERSLFEVELHCQVVSGQVLPYPRRDPALLSPEDQELELQFRHHKVYAVGHGAAANWVIDDHDRGRVAALHIDFLPRAEVPAVTPDNDQLDPNTLSLAFLADSGTRPDALCTALDGFVDSYGQWYNEREADSRDFTAQRQNTADRLLTHIVQAVERMRQGIALLRTNPQVRHAFAIANASMWRQMRQRDHKRGRHGSEYRWRPFQLGFFLLTLESIVNKDSAFRDTVDLIWFPTGGGKTEAYFALIAFQIALRRLQAPDSGGTTVIMRYTLRLLTQQQFQRATMLICALELMRREQPDALGDQAISVGLWVGAATSPNRFDQAIEVLNQATTAPRKLVITECPWCGASLWDHGPRGYAAGPKEFYFLCTNQDCELGNNGDTPLPLNVVDEALYSQAPTLLFATIDKFARLAWEARASVFLGGGEQPPALIIQDELHLVAGALGSVAGIYEAALDTLPTLRGTRPKTIASTATIRDAARQVRRLYGREHAVFPPQGLSADDAFFTRTVPITERPGRLYLGYLASTMNKREAFAALAAALLSGPIARFGDQPDLLDAWWTLLVYHGSLRGVGDSHNALQYLTPERLHRDLEAARTTQARTDDETGVSARLRRIETRQLTSIVSAEQNSRTFAQLEKPVSDPRHLDALLATNMISVGLDVGRLALMIVNGQPLTSAEYIQASSRVGRAGVPGLIVANYYRHQARSLSHYEHFRAYHESFYRYVEPTSVTPYTYQARRRALHAALVMVMRHGIDALRRNDDAGRFDPHEPSTAEAIAVLLQRCRAADPAHAQATEAQLNALVSAWAKQARDCRAGHRKLVYRRAANDRANEALMHSHGDAINGLWETLNSMRNVEDTALLRPTGLFAPPRATGKWAP